jgi:hypothetical protein
MADIGSILVRLLESTSNKTWKGSRRTFRPAVEVLEARLVPTTTLVPGGGGDGTNVMSWVPMAGAVTYNIYSGPSSGQETLDSGGTGLTNPSYIDTDNPNGVPIFYEFTAVNAAGQESARSNEIEMTPFDTMPKVTVDPTIGASTFLEGDNAMLGGFVTTQIDGGMPYPRLEDVNAPNDSGITGYDGIGFINLAYSDHATITWNNMWVSQAGHYALSWRYSQAPGVFDLPDRPVGLMVNGHVITNAMSLPELNSWNTWAMSPAITVKLDAGVNTIELFADNTITTGANPHIDSMRITSTNGPVTRFPPPPPIDSALNTIEDPGFESVTAAQLETGTASPWTFTAGPLLGNTMSAAGVAGNVGYFTSGNPHAPEGAQVAFVQGAASSFSQAIDFSTGTYSLTFQAARRAVNGGETFNVLVDGQVVGTFRPGGVSYSTFTTNDFALSAGSHTIKFLGAGSPGGKETALIDNLSLNTIQTADHLLFTQQPSDTVAGQSVSPAVTVAIVDQFGNVLSYDNTDTVTVAIGTNPSGGTLSGTLTVTVNGGVATFGDLSIDKAGSGYTLVASSSGLTGATSNSFAVNPATADHLVFLQQPTNTNAGQTISAVMVEVVDQFGNVVTSDNSDTVTVAIGNNPSGGTLSGTLTVTVSNGIASFGDLSIDLAGDGYTLHASADGLTAVDSNAFSITM